MVGSADQQSRRARQKRDEYQCGEPQANLPVHEDSLPRRLNLLHEAEFLVPRDQY
jgi:hypothetical protein